MILTKIISTDKVEILVIGGLPEEAVNVKIVKGENRNELFYWHNNATTFVRAIWDSVEDGNWQPVGFLKDISECEANRLMGNETTCNNFYNGTFTGIDTTAKESLLSLIESEVKLKNKYGELNYDHLSGIYRSEKGQADDYEWQAEQSDVFTNPFILIKK